MKKYIILFSILFLFTTNVKGDDNKMILKLKNGEVEIKLFPELAPKHVERIKTLLMRGGDSAVEGEPVTDSFSDISNYGVMAQVVARGKWAK